MSLNGILRSSEERYRKWKIESADWVEPDYLDLNDIIASQTSIQALVGPQTSKDVLPYVQLPLNSQIPPRGLKGNVNVWLLHVLSHSEPILPQSYNATTKQALQAGAAVLNFETDKRYFYELGRHLAETIHDQRTDRAQQLLHMLMDAYMERQRHIFKIIVDLESRPRKLSESEVRLFHKGQYSELRMKSWWSNVPKERQGYRKRYKR